MSTRASAWLPSRSGVLAELLHDAMLLLVMMVYCHHNCPCSTLAMIKPDAFRNMGKILHAICSSGFQIKCVPCGVRSLHI